MNCARVYVTAGGSAFGETKNNGPGHIPVSVLPLYEERRGAILEFPACILLSEDDPTPKSIRATRPTTRHYPSDEKRGTEWQRQRK